MNYALLQQEIGEQIKIVDNTTNLGKKRVEDLCNEGFVLIGYLESEQPPQRLLRGFTKDIFDKYDEKCKRLFDIREILDR